MGDRRRVVFLVEEGRVKWIVSLLREIAVVLPSDVSTALEDALSEEDSEVSRSQISAILDNCLLAKKLSAPMCQDTGIHVFEIQAGLGVSTNEILEWKKAIIEGVKLATSEIPLRPNAVHPLTRENSGNNVGVDIPYIKISLNPEIEGLRIIASIKGAGSENMTALKLFSPTASRSEIEAWILERVIEAGGKPCPPCVLGLGIGGTSPIAMELAEKALYRKVGKRHHESDIASWEEKLIELINKSGIGPMGLGGKTTVLDVHVEYAYCHTATLPVALRFGCWALRRAVLEVKEDYVRALVGDSVRIVGVD